MQGNDGGCQRAGRIYLVCFERISGKEYGEGGLMIKVNLFFYPPPAKYY